MVSSSSSGCSLTSRNTVIRGGSSSSFSILLEHVRFMRSGSHITLTLYPLSVDFMLSFLISLSLSASNITACCFSALMSVIHCSSEK